jgi:hypothetical protein
MPRIVQYFERCRCEGERVAIGTGFGGNEGYIIFECQNCTRRNAVLIGEFSEAVRSVSEKRTSRVGL